MTAGPDKSEPLDVEDNMMIQAAADEAGAPFDAAKRVFDLMNKIDKESLSEVGLKVVDGKALVAWMVDWDGERPDIEMPQSLWDEIDNLDFDIVELLDPILRAWQKRYGHPYPTLMRFAHHPDDPDGVLRPVRK